MRDGDAKASLPQQGANGAERHCRRTPQLQPIVCRPFGVGTRISQAVRNNEPNRSQRTNQDFDTQANNQPLLSSLQDEAYIRSGENDKRYRRHHPASRLCGQACRYLSLQFQTICSGTRARYPITTAGATLIRARMCVHVFFPSILHLAGPMERAPV